MAKKQQSTIQISGKSMQNKNSKTMQRDWNNSRKNSTENCHSRENLSGSIKLAPIHQLSQPAFFDFQQIFID